MKTKVSDGEMLQMLLKEKNVTIRELANLTGISEQTLYSMKKRKTNRTGKDILAKISNALNVPIGIWNMTEEEKILRETYGAKENTIVIDAENMSKLLELQNRSAEYIKFALDCLGYNNQYSVEDVENIISNEVSIDGKLAADIEYIVGHDELLNRTELDMLNIIRKMSKESRECLDAVIKKLVLADKYENMLMKEFAEALEIKR